MKLHVVKSPLSFQSRLAAVAVHLAGYACLIFGAIRARENKWFHLVSVAGLCLMLAGIALGQRKTKHRLISLFDPVRNSDGVPK